MIRKWNVFTAKTLGIEFSFNEVVEGILAFVRKPIESIEKGQYIQMRWSHIERNYME